MYVMRKTGIYYVYPECEFQRNGQDLISSESKKLGLSAEGTGHTACILIESGFDA